MGGFFRKISIIGIILLVAGAAFGQRRDQFELGDSQYLGFHFDDDFLFAPNRDEQYTGGIAFEYLRAFKSTSDTKKLLNPFGGGPRFWTATFGSDLYTPYNVSDSLLILNDRPFSSYTYLEIGMIAYDQSQQKRLSGEVFLGIMGSDLPGQVQSFVHQFGESAPANGWINDIAQKETFVPNFRFTYQENLARFKKIRLLPFKWLQIGSVAKLNVGLYLNSISAGLKFSGFNRCPTSGVAFKNFKLRTDLSDEKTDKLKLTYYFQPQLQLIGYTTALQSLPWLNSPYFLTGDLINRAVVMLEAGVNLEYKRFRMSYTVQARTKEFIKYRYDWHSWGGVTMGFSF
ncbi:MAG: DUF2219 family protein [Crocinitomix sp.]|nr:DUF2219 family protein [Crocinitomix sp.]